MSVEADDADSLRAALRDLHARRDRGDVTEKAFQSVLADRTVALYRARARERIGDGERIVAEHHVVRAHLGLNASILREPVQEATSLFATERSLVRVRSNLAQGREITADDRDGTRVDGVPIPSIRALRVRREVRWGEAAAGAAIVAVAGILHGVLQFTGPILAALGVLGILHAVVLPTRWIEVDSGADDVGPVRIEAAGRRSARALLRHLRERMP